MHDELTHIPLEGASVDHVLTVLDDYASDDQDPVAGLAAGSPFATGLDSVEAIGQQATLRFWDANAMYRRYFPSIARMERELVQMTGNLLNAPAGFGGAVSSGGSESILLAVKAARDAVTGEGRRERRTLVLSRTAHPAFWKAADYLDLQVRTVPLDGQMRLDMQAFEQALGPDVMLAVASAPSFVLGRIDPVGDMAALCRDQEIPLHVDCCVGGFALPWLERLGIPLAPFDFRVEGVMSISADLHKYGYAPRGASVVLSRTQQWTEQHVFSYGGDPRPEDWYVTPSVAGSRPAGAVAAAWAVMVHLGQAGYLELAAETRRTTQRMWSRMDELGLDVLAEPIWSLFVFSMGEGGALTPDLAASLRARGWLVHEDVFPQPLIRMMMAPGQFPYVDSYLDDLAAAVDEVSSGVSSGAASDAAYT